MASTNIAFGLLLLTPLLGFLFNGIRFRSHNATLAGSVATLASGISFVGAIMLVCAFYKGGATTPVSFQAFNWFSAGSFNVNFSFVVDRISSIMILIITGVGTLIHLFSMGYMSHDERPSKYFAYLNLFLFNMLLLVLGSNLLVMFVGWEGVGLCSYLLIGFWFKDPAKAAAGMKAFITNRIGDAGFLLGIFILFLTFGTVEFSSILQLLPATAESTWMGPITLACLCLFIGAAGKSAQIPLYVWLPDAMAGPTPVSALIHAATMVTAGVYMIVRLSGLFMLAPNVMELIAWTGALTAFFAATMGFAQNDIKKVLAYSTVSQLGFMFLAVGVGAFGAAMFHLMTHAFFKALMFLGSGSVIHGMHEEQDMRKMGGLAKHMPITHLTFLMGWLAIIGMPPFAGFFSKDEILWFAYSSPMGSKALWIVGILSAMCTAFYMTRLMVMTFWSKERFDHHEIHPHEGPATMSIPLIVLAVLSVIGGWIGIPHVIGAILPGHPENYFEHWLKPAIAAMAPGAHHTALEEWMTMGVSLGGAGISAALAVFFFMLNPKLVESIKAKMRTLVDVVANKYYVDEIYFGVLINPLIETSRNLWVFVDQGFIDRGTDAAKELAKGLGRFSGGLQSGKAQQYALYISLGTIVLIIISLIG